MYTKIQNLLNLTQQQMNVLRAVELASSFGELRPKSIAMRYKDVAGKPIQSSNLFMQIRTLMKEGIIRKSGKTYNIDTAEVLRILEKKKLELHEKLNECDGAAKNVGKIFSSIKQRTYAKSLDSDELFKFSAENVRNCDTLRIVAFPIILFSEQLQTLIGAKEFAEELISRCKNGELVVKYLTSMDSTYPFSMALRCFGNKERALKEVRDCYKRATELLSVPNIELRYMKTFAPFYIYGGPRIEAVVFPMPFISTTYIPTSGVVIENRDVSMAYKNMFDAVWQSTAPLDTNTIKAISRTEIKKLIAKRQRVIK